MVKFVQWGHRCIDFVIILATTIFIFIIVREKKPPVVIIEPLCAGWVAEEASDPLVCASF